MEKNIQLLKHCQVTCKATYLLRDCQHFTVKVPWPNSEIYCHFEIFPNVLTVQMDRGNCTGSQLTQI